MKKNIKNNYKRIIILIFILIVLFPIIGTLAKYVYQNNYDAYFNSKEFYFNSSILTSDNKIYNIDNWDGSSYSIDIDIENKLNNEAWTSYNIDYDISVSCPTTVSCNLTTPESNTLIYNANKYTENNIGLEIIPISTFQKGDKVEVTVTATSRTKYQKTISATFVLTVTTYGLTYNITDSVNSYFLTLDISNTTSDVKNINLSFDNSKLSIDNTSTVVIMIDDQDIIKDSNNKINGLNLKVTPAEEITIKFFKKDITKNYTYPLVNDESIIKINEN